MAACYAPTHDRGGGPATGAAVAEGAGHHAAPGRGARGLGRALGAHAAGEGGQPRGARGGRPGLARERGGGDAGGGPPHGGASGVGGGGARRTAPNRLWSVALLYLGGYDMAATARALGYAHIQSVAKALKHPAVVRIIALVRDAQLERVMRGDYGVIATAKAAAPAVMEHVA